MPKAVPGSSPGTLKPLRKCWVLARNFGCVHAHHHEFYEAGTEIDGELLKRLKRLGAEMLEIEA